MPGASNEFAGMESSSRSEAIVPPTRRMPPRKHFGETLRASKYSHRLTRNEYALVNKRNSTRPPREYCTDAEWEADAWAFEDEDHTRLTDEHCAMHREAALENFDLNMAFFRQLSGKDFLEAKAMAGMLAKHKNLRPLTDLSVWDGVEGIYVMVLDRYKQAYIGQARDIRARIKRHWSWAKQFDRLIFGTKESSVLSIDSFRALDTTRIFAVKTTRGLDLEERMVKAFPPEFLLNRVPGGDRIMGDRFLPWEIKRRQLLPVDSEADPSGVAST
jgi:hypothetical protein